MQHMRHTSGLRQSGFTLLELLVALPLIAIVTTVFIATLVNTLQLTTARKTQLELNNATQFALNNIERDVRYGSAYQMESTASYTETNLPAGYTNVWSNKGPSDSANNRALIIKSFATTTSIYNRDRRPIYADGAPTYNCSPTGTLYLNDKISYLIIYFINDNTLYRRILTDTTTPQCSGQSPVYQKRSCPPGSLLGTQVTECRAYDEVIAKDVVKLSIDYYKQNDEPDPTFDQVIDAYTSTDPLTVSTADNADITLGLQKITNGKPVSSELQLVVSMVNR